MPGQGEGGVEGEGHGGRGGGEGRRAGAIMMMFRTVQHEHSSLPYASFEDPLRQEICMYGFM